MSKIFICICAFFTIINVINSVALSKSKTKVDELMYSSLTSAIYIIQVFLINLAEIMFNMHMTNIKHLDMIIILIICSMFIIINGFIMISKSMIDESKSKCIFGFFIMILFPIHLILSLPILAIILLVRYKEFKDHEITVCEEEILDLEYNLPASQEQ